MAEKKTTAALVVVQRRWPLLAPFEVRLRTRPEALPACFESQPDVTVSSRWPRSNAPRRWFIARVVSARELRLRIAPKQSPWRFLGNIRDSIDLELRLTASGSEGDAVVEARVVPVFTAGFYASFLSPGVGIFFGAWVLFGGAMAVLITAAVILGLVWPRRLFEDAKELRSKVSAALGPALLEEDAVDGYRSDGGSS